MTGGFLKGFSVGKDGPYNKFEDDVSIFCKFTIEQIKMLTCVLRCFKAISNTLINHSKSTNHKFGLV